jgi:hypothetical protein
MPAGGKVRGMVMNAPAKKARSDTRARARTELHRRGVEAPGQTLVRAASPAPSTWRTPPQRACPPTRRCRGCLPQPPRGRCRPSSSWCSSSPRPIERSGPSGARSCAARSSCSGAFSTAFNNSPTAAALLAWQERHLLAPADAAVPHEVTCCGGSAAAAGEGRAHTPGSQATPLLRAAERVRAGHQGAVRHVRRQHLQLAVPPRLAHVARREEAAARRRFSRLVGRRGATCAWRSAAASAARAAAPPAAAWCASCAPRAVRRATAAARASARTGGGEHKAHCKRASRPRAPGRRRSRPRRPGAEALTCMATALQERGDGGIIGLAITHNTNKSASLALSAGAAAV